MPVEYTFEGSALHPSAAVWAFPGKHNATIVRRMTTRYESAKNQQGSTRILLPTDLNPAGTVTFAVAFMPSGVVPTTTNVQFRVSYAAVAAGENYDIAYANSDSGNVNAAGLLTNHRLKTWTALVSALGWSAEDLVYLRVQRINATVEENASVLDVTMFRVTVPTL